MSTSKNKGIFTGFLGHRISFGVAWTQHALAVVQPSERLPSSLGMHFASSALLDPVGDFGATPQPAISWWLLAHPLELCLLLSGQDEAAFRIVVAAVAQSCWPLVIVATNETANPVVAVAGDLRSLLGRFSLLPAAR